MNNELKSNAMQPPRKLNAGKGRWAICMGDMNVMVFAGLAASHLYPPLTDDIASRQGC